MGENVFYWKLLTTLFLGGMVKGRESETHFQIRYYSSSEWKYFWQVLSDSYIFIYVSEL